MFPQVGRLRLVPFADLTYRVCGPPDSSRITRSCWRTSVSPLSGRPGSRWLWWMRAEVDVAVASITGESAWGLRDTVLGGWAAGRLIGRGFPIVVSRSVWYSAWALISSQGVSFPARFTTGQVVD